MFNLDSYRIDKKVNEVSDKLNSIMEQELFNTLTSKVEEVKELLTDVYTRELVNVVDNPDSRTKPEDYLEEFEERLDEFEFVTITDGEVIFTTPDMDNFNFSGRLRVIESILEGVVGNYVEVDGDQWTKIFGKSDLPSNPTDDTAPADDRIYLLRYNQFIKNVEKELDTKFVEFPFSNIGPIDIFTEVEEYVPEKLPEWMDEAIANAQTKLKEAYI